MEFWSNGSENLTYRVATSIHCHHSTTPTLLTPTEMELDDQGVRLMLPAFQLPSAILHDYCYGFEARGASDGLKLH